MPVDTRRDPPRFGVATAPDGTIYLPGLLMGETDYAIYTIDPMTGAHTLYKGPAPLMISPAAVAFVTEVASCTQAPAVPTMSWWGIVTVVLALASAGGAASWSRARSRASR